MHDREIYMDGVMEIFEQLFLDFFVSLIQFLNP